MDTSEIVAEIDAEIQGLREVKALLDGGPTSKPGAKPSPKRGRRKMSAAGRARTAAAQKAPVSDGQGGEVSPQKRLRPWPWKAMAGALT
jgi:hypothetical protein